MVYRYYVNSYSFGDLNSLFEIVSASIGSIDRIRVV